ncbi:MAG: hypothetical protein V7746_12245 [Halioglobus sp.]
MNVELTRKDYKIILGCFVILSHIFLLLNDGSYWDGGLADFLMSHGQATEVAKWFNDASLYPQTWLYWLSHLTPNPKILYVTIAISALMMIAQTVFLVVSKYTPLSDRESFLLSALCIAFPGYNVLVSSIFNLHMLSMLLFFFGWYLFIESVICYHSKKLKLCSYLILMASFFHNSLLVFHFGFLLFVFFVFYNHEAKDKTKLNVDVIKSTIGKTWIVALLPIFFYFSVKFFLPTTGQYEDYNTLIINWDHFTTQEKISRVLYRGNQFWDNAIYHQFEIIYNFVIRQFSLFIALIVIIVGIFLKFREVRSNKNIGYLGVVTLIIFGCILLLLAVLPYLAVGKGPWAYFGWGTRFELQMGLPIAIVLFGLVKLITRQLPAIVTDTFLALLVCGFIMVLTKNYLMWQARWVKDLSVISHLQTSNRQPEGTVILWEDDFVVGGQEYAYYELSTLLATAWGKEAWLPIWRYERGKPLKSAEQYFEEKGSVVTTHKNRYGYADLGKGNRIAQLSIKQANSTVSAYDIALNYYFLKLTGSSQMPVFLDSVTEIQFDAKNHWPSLLKNSVMVVGDSISEGANTSNYASRAYVSLIRKHIQNKYSNHHHGFVNFLDTDLYHRASQFHKITADEHSRAAPRPNYFGGWWLRPTPKIELSYVGQSFYLVYEVRPADGAILDVYVDGALVRQVDTSEDNGARFGSPPQAFSELIDVPSWGRHEVTMISKNMGVANLMGNIYFGPENNSSEMINNVSRSSVKLTEIPNDLLNFYSSQGGDFIFSLGANDYLQQSDVDRFREKLELVFDNVTQNGGKLIVCDFIFTAPKSNPYKLALREISEQYPGSIFLDFGEIWYGSDNARQRSINFLDDDGIHPTELGHADIAEVILERHDF